jgi:hypothetical protein
MDDVACDHKLRGPIAGEPASRRKPGRGDALCADPPSRSKRIVIATHRRAPIAIAASAMRQPAWARISLPITRGCT